MAIIKQSKNTQFEIITNAPDWSSSGVTSYPFPYNDSNVINGNGASSSKIINRSGGAASFTALGVQQGDYVLFPDAVDYYQLYQVQSVPTATQITLTEPLKNAVVAGKMYFIRPVFSRMEFIFIPDAVADQIDLDGRPIIASGQVSPFTLVWDKSADSHSAERNLLAPIVMNVASLASGVVYLTGTKY